MRTSPQRSPRSAAQPARAQNHLAAVPDPGPERRTDRDPYWAAVVIRRAVAADAVALRQLAELDSARGPAGDAVVAEQGGSMVAAVSLSDGVAVADPFRATADVVALLRLRAGQLKRAGVSAA